MSVKKSSKPGIRRPRKVSKNKGRGTQLTGRTLPLHVKTARGRKSSSTRWLKRQLNDPYVAEAQKRGYRSRSAFKLIELDERFRFLSKGSRIVDLGAAPGGWCQVAAERANTLGTEGKIGRVVGLDIKDIDAINGVEFLQGDFLEDTVLTQLIDFMDGPVDIVLSDMAAGTTGHSTTDHLRIMGLLEAAVDFAIQVLRPGGTFVGKVFKGGTENELLVQLKSDFTSVHHAKPPASRNDSTESYLVARGFVPQNKRV